MNDLETWKSSLEVGAVLAGLAWATRHLGQKMDELKKVVSRAGDVGERLLALYLKIFENGLHK